MKTINVAALILILIGALNWGLWGFFQFDFVAWAFGGHYSWFSRLIYAIIGLAGVWGLSFFGQCGGMKSNSTGGSGSSDGQNNDNKPQ